MSDALSEVVNRVWRRREFKLLDHGYLKSVEVWGSDEAIVEAARMSTQKGFLGWGPKPCPDCDGQGIARIGGGDESRVVMGAPDCGTCKGKGEVSGDEKLLRYLYENKHATPFEFAGLVVEVQAPIFVFREWHRHRTQSYNEMSARYAPLPDLNYIPTVERIMLGGGHLTKQAGTVKDAEVLTESAAIWFRGQLARSYQDSQMLYEDALRQGVPKELARVHLPVGRYSRMRAHTCLRNWLAFMTLRSAPTAQWEIRQYSDAIGRIIADVFPRTWALFSEGKNR